MNKISERLSKTEPSAASDANEHVQRFSQIVCFGVAARFGFVALTEQSDVASAMGLISVVMLVLGVGTTLSLKRTRAHRRTMNALHPDKPDGW